MKYTLINQVNQGDILGRHIYASDGRILLHEGVSLTIGLLSKLRRMGVHTVYIKDKRLEDVQVEEVLSEKTKLEAIKTVASMYQYIQKDADIQLKSLNHSVKNIIDELTENQHMLLSLMDIRTEDNQLYVHSVNVCMMSLLIGIQMKLDQTKLKELAIGALLHDVGKALPDSNKKSAKREEDNNHHTWKGFNALRKNKEISLVSAHIALSHHEHIDGTGTPRNLKDDDIHLFAKIVAVANYYDNLISPIDASVGIHPYEACERIMGLTNLYFDHEVVWKFLRSIAFYPNGSQVLLSNGETGVVVSQHKGLPQRPIVRTFNVTGSNSDDYEINELDLAKQTTTFIKEIL